MNKVRLTSFVSSLVALTACNKVESPEVPGTGSIAGATETAEVITTVHAFLSLSIATRELHLGMLDSVYATSAGKPGEDSYEVYDHVRWLADAKVLEVRAVPDSAEREVTAVLTTVADVVEGTPPDTFIATMGVREDTVHFSVGRGSYSQGRWVVLGSPREGFGFNTGLRGVRWTPPGASPEKAKAMVDSIRQARGMARVR